MPHPISDATALLRDAIRQVLAQQTQPVYSDQVYSAYAVSSLGLSPVRVQAQLAHMAHMKREHVERIRAPNGRLLWAYYDPRVCTPMERRTRSAPPVVDAAELVQTGPGTFHFNPIDVDEPAPTANVQVPQNVRAIAISIGGVTLRIELTA